MEWPYKTQFPRSRSYFLVGAHKRIIPYTVCRRTLCTLYYAVVCTFSSRELLLLLLLRNRRLWVFFTASRRLTVIYNHTILAVSNMYYSLIYIPGRCARFLRFFWRFSQFAYNSIRLYADYVQHRSRRTPDRVRFEQTTVGISAFNNFFLGSTEEQQLLRYKLLILVFFLTYKS